jgi:hypothetical protein
MPATASTTSAMSAPAGIPPPGFGCQNSVPVTDVFCAPTCIGTRQSKTFVRLLVSVTCFGATLLIQWMRWSCHWKLLVRSTTFQSGRS